MINMGLGTLSDTLHEAGPLLLFIEWKVCLFSAFLFCVFSAFLLSHLHLFFYIGLTHLHFLLRFICFLFACFLHFKFKYQVYLILQGSRSHNTKGLIKCPFSSPNSQDTKQFKTL